MLLTALVWLRRLVLTAGWVAVLAFLIAVGAAWWLTATPTGVQWTLAQAEQRVSGLSIGESRGTLWRGLVLEQVAWSPEQGASAAIGEARLQIDAASLLRGRLRVPELVVRDGTVDLPAADPTDSGEQVGEPFDPDDLALPPLSLDIEQLLVERLVIRQQGRAFELSQARLAALLDARVDRPRLELDLDELDLLLPDGLRLNARAAVALEPVGDMPLIGHADILLDHPQGWLSGQVEADGDLLGELGLRPRLAWMGADGLPAALCGRLRLEQQALTVEQLVADLLGGRLELAGMAVFSPTTRVELKGRGESLNPAWASPGTPGSLSFGFDTTVAAADGWLPAEGRVSVAGLTGELAGESIEDVDIDLRVDATRAEVRVAGQAGGGELRLDGQLDAERHLQAEWQIDALPLGRGAQGHPVHLASRGRLDARLPNGNRPLVADEWLSALEAQLADARLELVERGADAQQRAVTLEMAGGLAGGRLTVERLGLDAPGAGLNVAGGLELASDWAQWRLDDVQGNLAIPDLAALPWDLAERLPGVDLAPLRPKTARGSIRIDMDASGPILAPQGQLDARIDGLRLAGYSLERARALATIDPADAQTALMERDMAVSVDADALVPDAGEALFERLAFAAEGRPSSHQATLEIDGPVDVGMAADGGWSLDEAAGWQGRLTRLALDLPAGQSWRLREPAGVSVRPESQQIDSLCLQPVAAELAADQAGSLCLSGERAGSLIAAELDGDLALEALWRQLPAAGPDGVEWPGRLSLAAEARLDEASRSASLELRLPASEIRFAGRGDDLEGDTASRGPDAGVVAYPEARLSARLADERVEASLQGGIEDWLAVDGQGQAELDDGALDGALSLQEAELARLFDLVDRLFGPLGLPITDLAGSLSGRIAASGRLDAPRLSGQLLGEDLSFASLPTGTQYRDGRVDLAVEPDGALRLTGELLGEAEPPPRPVFSARRVDETESPKSRGRITLDGSGQVMGPDD
ncbi:MAG: hypothetical protein ABR561_08055, partial [Guyparkeria sp.]